MNARRGIFLDRDGVLVEDAGPVTRLDQFRLLPGVPAALARLKQAGYLLLMASNQSVVARGLASEAELHELHRQLSCLLVDAGGPGLDASYFCPHHPNADLPAYRSECDCRKPRPGLLWRGAADFGLDLSECFMIGDRLTDVAAGRRAGCRTILVQTGQHDAPLIATVDPWDPSTAPDHVCRDLLSATDWILNHLSRDLRTPTSPPFPTP